MTRRGTSNTNARGSAEARRRRKAWLLTTFGDGTYVACAAEDCGSVLTFDTLTVDRFPIPGCQGGRYVRGNIRPMCGPCNSKLGGSLRATA